MSNKHTQLTQTETTAPQSWRSIVLEALHPHRGRTLGLAEIYDLVGACPGYVERAGRNKDPEARVRATCQRLRDTGLLKWESKGRWHVPETLTV